MANKNQLQVGQVINQAITMYQQSLEENTFDIPQNYSYKNAIQQARYLLEKPIESGANKGKTILDICTPESILRSVMEMAQKGLSPEKKQCYFIPYGNTCTLSISYQGNVAMAKRNGEDIGDVYGYAVYKNDEIELDYDIKAGTINIVKFKPDPTQRKKENITGAFAVITNKNGEVKYTEIMTMEQIRDARNMGASKGNSPAHRNFPDQQAIKTVKSRAVKSFVNTSDDSDIVNEEEKASIYTDKNFNEKLNKYANKKNLEIDSKEEKEEQNTKQEEKENKTVKDAEEKPGEKIEDENFEGQSDFFDDDFEILEEAPF
jgi:recombination protein RecT